MSRIGRAPITVPSGVEVSIDGRQVKVTGPKGALDLEVGGEITVRRDGEEIVVERPNDERRNRAMHGLTRSLVNNMVLGVSEGFAKELQIIGIGYRCIAKGTDSLELQLGFSHSIHVKAPAGISFDVPEPTRIIVSGPDKQVVGQVAADIRALRKPEPYKGKGVRYLGEYVARKAGKAAK
jgi:large subunit ribosomal protein L6